MRCPQSGSKLETHSPLLALGERMLTGCVVACIPPPPSASSVTSTTMHHTWPSNLRTWKPSLVLLLSCHQIYSLSKSYLVLPQGFGPVVPLPGMLFPPLMGLASSLLFLINALLHHPPLHPFSFPDSTGVFFTELLTSWWYIMLFIVCLTPLLKCKLCQRRETVPGT